MWLVKRLLWGICGGAVFFAYMSYLLPFVGWLHTTLGEALIARSWHPFFVGVLVLPADLFVFIAGLMLFGFVLEGPDERR